MRPMPSPRGTNRARLFLRSPAYGVAHDQGVEWTKERRREALKDPSAVDVDEKIRSTRKDLEDHLAKVISDPSDLDRAIGLLNSHASALTDPGPEGEDEGEGEGEQERGAQKLGTAPGGGRMGMDRGGGKLARLFREFPAPRKV